MKPQSSIEYLVGFFMGFFFGLGLNIIFYLYNFLCKFLGWVRLEISWWMLVPLPLFCSFVMAKAIANLHLEDY